MRCGCLASLSVRWRLVLSLRFRGFHPPHEIVGKARERAFKRLAGLANGFAVGRQGLCDGTNGDRARDHHHSHLGECAVPGGCRTRTRQTPARIARDCGGPPEPLLEEMIGEVLQSRLNAPIVFAGDEHEPVSVTDLASEPFKGLGGFALRIFLVHSVEDREVDRLGVDQLDIAAPAPQSSDYKLGEADTHPVRTVGAVKHEDTVAHGILPAVYVGYRKVLSRETD